MAVLSVNTALIPEVVPLIPAGDYSFVCTKVDDLEPKGKREAGVEFTSQVADGPQKGKLTRDFFPYSALLDLENFQTVRFGNFARAAGVSSDANGNLDVQEFVNKGYRARVVHRNYIDDATKETKEAANISKYLWKDGQ